jgi:acetyl esterase/lipase
MIGSKDDYFGFYGFGTIARCLAERGLVVVLPNYRLSPAVRHPEHIKDVARAFAWTCRHVHRFGGNPGQIFAGGHSAGGHLAALLATDEQYLKAVGHGRKDIRGVIGISGVYRVDDFDLKLSLTGPGGPAWLRAEVRPFASVFGDDPKVARDASPINHVVPGLPPFLLINAGLDYPALPKMAEDFATALKKNGCEVKSKTVPWRTHETLLFDIGRRSVDTITRDLVVEFIKEHTGEAPRSRP